MKKRLFFIAFAAVLCLGLFAGCDDGGAETLATPTPAPSALSISNTGECKVCGGVSILCPYYSNVIYVTKDDTDVYCHLCKGWATLEFTGVEYEVDFDDCAEVEGCRVIAHLREGVTFCTYTSMYDCRKPQEVTYIDRITHTVCGFNKRPTYINSGRST